MNNLSELTKGYLMSFIVIIILIIIMYGSLLVFPRGNVIEKAAEELAENLIEKKTGLKIDLPE